MENWRERRSSEKYKYVSLLVVFLQTTTTWFVDACEVSLISESIDIVAEAKGPEQEQRRGKRTRNMDWWPVRGGRGGVG